MNLSNSGYLTKLRCDKAYYYREVCKRVPKGTSKPMFWGTGIHKALEDFWTNKPLETALKTVRDYFNDEVDWAKADATITAYYKVYEDDRKNWSFIAVEGKVETVIDDDLTHQMTFDALARNNIDGKLYFPEHKTTSFDISPASAYWKKLYYDSQISSYTYALSLKYEEHVGTIYDVIKKEGSHGPAKPSIRPYRIKQNKIKKGKIKQRKNETEQEFELRVIEYDKKFALREIEENETDEAFVLRQSEEDETDQDFELRKIDGTESFTYYRDRLFKKLMENKTEFFRRESIARTPDDLTNWLNEFIAVASDISRCKQKKMWPRNHNACQGRYGECEYISVCCGLENIDSDNFKDAEDRYKKEEVADVINY